MKVTRLNAEIERFRGFKVLLLALIVIILPSRELFGAAEYRYMEPPRGTLSANNWDIVYNDSSQPALGGTQYCNNLLNGSTGNTTLALSTTCLGALNSFPMSFFRSHIKRHQYFTKNRQIFDDGNRMLFRVFFKVRFDLSRILQNWQLWAPLFLNPTHPQILTNVQGVRCKIEDRLTGIPWFESTLELSFLSEKMREIVLQLQQSIETSSTKQIIVNAHAPTIDANFTIGWNVLEDRIILLQDHHILPMHQSDLARLSTISSHASSTEFLPILLSMTSSIASHSGLSGEEINRLWMNHTTQQLLLSQMLVRLDNFQIQYLSMPSKIPFSNLQEMSRSHVKTMETEATNTRENPCWFRDISPTQAAILDHITYSPHLYPRHQNLASLPRILCSIYSTAKSHGTKLKAIRDTWGRKCTAFLVFSTQSDPSLPAIHVPHLGDESYGNMWQKSRAIWRYLHFHYLREFDFFLLGGDDMYYIMENLYSYLKSDEMILAYQRLAHTGGLYLGRQIRFQEGNDEEILHSGGAGYLLSQLTLEKLFATKAHVADINGVLNNSMVSFFDYKPECSPTLRTSAEDFCLSKCLRALGVTVYNTAEVPVHDIDGKHDAPKERFHFLSPLHLAEFDPVRLATSWVTKLPVSPVMPGIHGMSRSSVSFHFVSPDEMYGIDAYLYSCPRHPQNRVAAN